MADVMMVAPNTGWCMGQGGGCRVAAKIAEIINHEGLSVYIVALSGYTKNQIEQLHGVKLPNTKLHYILGAGENRPIPSPVGFYFVSLQLKRLLSTVNPKFLMFHDDVFPSVVNIYTGKTLLYVHFPLAARIKFFSSNRSIKERIYDCFNQRIIAYDKIFVHTILANSTISAKHSKMTWNRSDVKTLYPPVDVKNTKTEFTSRGLKNDLVVCLGRISPEKRFEIAIRACALSKLDYNLILVGNKSSQRYNNYLCSLMDQLGVRDKVKILTGVTEEQKWKILSKAKIIVHPATFEPFGISVVEGMCMGVVPVVYRGPFSGPWIDIIERGAYGFGFTTCTRLSKIIDGILSDEELWCKYSALALKRSRMFSAERFRRDFLGVLEELSD